MCGTGMILCVPTLFQHLFSCLPSRHHLLVAWGCLCVCQLCHGADIRWHGETCLHACHIQMLPQNAGLFTHCPNLAMMCGGMTTPVCIPAVPSTVTWWCGTPVHSQRTLLAAIWWCRHTCGWVPEPSRDCASTPVHTPAISYPPHHVMGMPVSTSAKSQCHREVGQSLLFTLVLYPSATTLWQ